MEGSNKSAPERNDDPRSQHPEKEPITEGGPSAPAPSPEDRSTQRLRDLLAAARLEDEKWMEAERRRATALEEDSVRQREAKELYFFYGSLMDPSYLQQVLGLPVRPVLRPAVLHGWHMKMWGELPALTDDGPGEPIQGLVFEVEGSEAKDRLTNHETVMFREQMCEVTLEGSEETVAAKTFVWAAGPSALKPGKFNLKVWQQKRLESQ
ncbi:hypothetical protein SLS53_004450 [Cytospora paraplurivora]|uniref:Putative gamma-glutamylcyclotransferase n=1 Tax=Cytospora paraplurivora TaxID=2898453 RepID=A0AAN9UA60_9PEZI